MTMRTSHRLRSLALLPPPLLAACGGIPLPGGEPGPRQSLSRREIATKRAPSELVATDGSTCHVSPTRFEKARAGSRAWCAWRERAAAASQPGARP